MIIPAYIHSVRIGFYLNTIYMFESIRKIAMVGLNYIFYLFFLKSLSDKKYRSRLHEYAIPAALQSLHY